MSEMRLNIKKAKAYSPPDGFIPNPKLKLLDQVSEVMRFKHYSIRTEETYREWIKRFILFHGKRHPREMGAWEVGQFVSHLAVACQVASSTQNQALNAIVFLYGQVFAWSWARLVKLSAPRNPNGCQWS